MNLQAVLLQSVPFHRSRSSLSGQSELHFLHPALLLLSAGSRRFFWNCLIRRRYRRKQECNVNMPFLFPLFVGDDVRCRAIKNKFVEKLMSNKMLFDNVFCNVSFYVSVNNAWHSRNNDLNSRFVCAHAHASGLAEKHVLSHAFRINFFYESVECFLSTACNSAGAHTDDDFNCLSFGITFLNFAFYVSAKFAEFFNCHLLLLTFVTAFYCGCSWDWMKSCSSFMLFTDSKSPPRASCISLRFRR